MEKMKLSEVFLKTIKAFVFYCPLVFSLGCDLFKDETIGPTEMAIKQTEDWPSGQNNEGPPEKDEGLYSLRPVMNRERLTDRNWITAEARPGDKLLITLEGVKQIPWVAEEIYPFEDFYHDIVVDHCPPDGGKCPHRLPYYPNCFVRYQEIHDGKRENIIFPDDVFSLDVKIKMNERIYPVGTIVEHKGTEIIAEFTIIEEMVNRERTYTSTYLIKTPLQENESTTIVKGFINFVNPNDCPKDLPTQERSFYRSRESVTSKMEYFGSVILKRKKAGGEK